MGISYTKADFVKNAANATGGAFLVSQDLESFSGKTEVLNSGISTVSNQIFFNGTYSSTLGQMLVTFFVHHDIMLEIEGGLARVLF